MPKTHRKTRLAKYNRKKQRCGYKSLIFLGIVVGVIALLLLLVKLTTRFPLTQNDKLSIVVNSPSGDLIISTFDKQSNEITNLTIPGNTQLQVSRQLGSWKARSIWQLGENEKVGGELLRQTIIKNFHFPILVWASPKAIGLTSGQFWPVVKAVFSFYKSNLGFGDKLKLAIFSLGAGNHQRNDIDLGKTALLRKVRLVDGEDGYLPSDRIPDNLLVVFSAITSEIGNLKAHIVDATGKNYLGTEVGKTLEIIGIKVASVEGSGVENYDCQVSGKDKKLVGIISKLFTCQKSLKSPEGNYDLEIKLGEAFGKRY